MYISNAATSCPITIFDIYTQPTHRLHLDENPDLLPPNTHGRYIHVSIE